MILYQIILTKLVALEKEVEPWLANITINMEPRDI
jgi:hypothetical protein